MVLSTLIYSLGVVTCVLLLTKLIGFLGLHRRSSSLPRYRQRADTWALVTGATDGIGLAFIKELASNGFNVILHGRNAAKLKKLKAQLSDDHPKLHFRSLVLDASVPLSEKQITDTTAWLQEVHLTILINNVGGVEVIMNPPAVGPLARHSHEDINNLMNLNAGFPTQLTRALWPMLANNLPSLVMNISSAASLGFPYATIYSGSKAFVESFTHGLYAEAHAESHDVEVLGIVVGTVTDVSHRKEPVSLLTPNATTMARAALGKVGCGRAVVDAWVAGGGCWVVT